jgi:hypothetical protein
MSQMRGGDPGSGLGNYATTRREEDAEHRRAFNSYLRMGAADMPTEQRALLQGEYRDMGSGVLGGAYQNSTSGFFVPLGFVHRVEDALKYFGPMLNGGRGFPQILDTDTGAPMPYPAADDTASTGEQVGEYQQVTTRM